MKTIIPILFIISFQTLCGTGLKAQIVFEATYNNEILKVTKFTDSTTYYYSTQDTVMNIYDESNILFRAVAFPFTFSKDSMMVYYVSQYLFDTDTEIEYVTIQYFVGQNGEPVAKGNMKVYNEDGTVLFSEDSVIADKFYFLHGITPLIVNTGSGAKMIVRKAVPSTHHTKVYGLPGVVYNVVEKESSNQQGEIIFRVFPNPMDQLMRIAYKLPEGVSNGVLTILDLTGKTILTLEIDDFSEQVTIPTDGWATGVYSLRITTEAGVSEGINAIKVH